MSDAERQPFSFDSTDIFNLAVRDLTPSEEALIDGLDEVLQVDDVPAIDADLADLMAELDRIDAGEAEPVAPFRPLRPIHERLLPAGKTVPQGSSAARAQSISVQGSAAGDVREGLVGPSNPSPQPPTNPLPLTPWRSLSPVERFRASVERAAQSNAAAFSLNLPPSRAASLQASNDPTRNLGRALARAFQKHFGSALPCAFTLEFTAGRRLHVHGVAVLPSLDQDAIKLLRLTLRSAGGKVSGYGSGRQCDVRELTDSRGWFSYVTKDLARTRRLLKTDKVAYVSADLRRQAEDAHERRRKIATATRTAAAAPCRVPDTAEAPSAAQRTPTAVSESIRPSVDLDQLPERPFASTLHTPGRPLRPRGTDPPQSVSIY